MSDSIVAEARGGVLTVVLQREERGNALDAQSVEALHAALAEAARPEIRLLVLRGAGRSFCTGFDLAGLETQSDGDLLLRFTRIELLLQAIRHAPVPSLALAHGRAFGAGADLFAACTWRVAAPGTRFAFPGARFGLVLGTRRLAAIIGTAAALELTACGRILEAADAVRFGLATQLAPAEDWPALISGLVGELAATDRETVLALRHAAQADTRMEDLADLVRSAARPGLRERILAYASARRG
ncbi:enoyl-CoA hydratase/isomerase family protein [Limobrevibacterium gyesilva]|uniref:Enoyl-CoA hydratase/isomerase family protein n=1 Tax=Limobrevibacterium gyesilva TaxID=2991712 RepID=A0AA42CD58_9PROT|nr:enoyl-CoA hydratase/isomerase family protein [Limobrevibacterium gyesilva]MCW3473299.1 enoyl-CoA hydratase/isomerase family protein [Limobrevibacterium gyesilva]